MDLRQSVVHQAARRIFKTQSPDEFVQVAVLIPGVVHLALPFDVPIHQVRLFRNELLAETGRQVCVIAYRNEDNMTEPFRALVARLRRRGYP